MPKTENNLMQTDILRDLLEAAFQGYASGRIPEHADIVIGANATLLTFRSFGEGLPLEYADTLGQKFRTHMHNYERLWFYEGVCTVIHYHKGELVREEPMASNTPDGLLFRLGWDTPLPKELVLTVSTVREIARQVLSDKDLKCAPEIWFNGERVIY